MGKVFGKMKRRRLIIILSASAAAVLLLAVLIALFSPSDPVYDFSEAYNYYKNNKVKASLNEDITLTFDNITSAKNAVENPDGYDGTAAEIDAESVDFGSVTYTARSVPAGTYYLELYYSLLGDAKSDYTLSLNINDTPQASVPKEHSLIPLTSYWKYKNKTFLKDRSGNDVLPLQVRQEGFIRAVLQDFEYKTEFGLPVELKAGDNTVKISLSAGKMQIAELKLISPKAMKSYEEYSAAYAGKGASAAASRVIQAELPDYKSDISALPKTLKDRNAQPYEDYTLPLNVMEFSKAGGGLFYEFEAETSGLYNLAFNYCSADANATVFREISVDGKVPFGELAHYPLPYSASLKYHTLGIDGQPFGIYLEAGKHTLAVRADGVPAAGLSAPLKEVTAGLSDKYLQIKKLVGVNPDKNRDWTIADYFPDIVAEFNGYIDIIGQSKAAYISLNGTDASTQASVFMDTAVLGLKSLLEKPDKIPNRVAKISEGTDSVVQSLSAAVKQMSEPGLTLDSVYITGAAAKTAFKTRSGWFSFVSGVKSFFHSFAPDASKKTSGDELAIWVNRPLGDINLMQSMIDTEFTARNGIKVRLSMLKDEKKLILSNASGIRPDGVMGVSSWIPYELGLRGLVYDMNSFNDKGEVLSRFAPGAMLPLIVDGKIYALPETQDATVLFYRKDILGNMGLSVPGTWDELTAMLPQLQSGGMNVYLPLSGVAATKTIAMTSPFIYQYGGDLYAPDGVSTAIDREPAINGIRLMTDFYIKYGLPGQVANFAESFRDGSVPLGVATLATYSQLLVSAPELNGLWDIALSPGTDDGNGNIIRWQPAAATACSIMSGTKRAEDVWKLFSWWMSEEIQGNYAQHVRAVWGNEFIWASANLKAFESSVFPSGHKKVILKQWEWVFEVPRVPGWYMIERELSSAWNSIVFDGVNVRLAIDTAAANSNREIKRKLTELGYMKDGDVVKDFKITTMQDVRDIIAGGGA